MIDLSKTPQIIWFVVMLPTLSLVLVLLLNLILTPISNNNYFIFLDTFGVLGAYGVLYGWFNVKIWKNPIFKKVGIVEQPCLEGRWKGTLRSSYDGRKRKTPAILEIRQTFSSIKTSMYLERSKSVSLVAGFITEGDGEIYLHYEYQNDPGVSAEESMNIHYGVARLQHDPLNKKLVGTYYNSPRHDRGHFGEISVVFESNKMKGCF